MNSSSVKPTDRSSAVHASGIASIFLLYVVWGSTYLALSVAVEPGVGFGPFTMALIRTVIAGAVFLGYARWRKLSILPARRDWATLIPSGVLLWVGANGMVAWALMRADSGYAALAVGSLPIWTAVIESVIDRRHVSLPMGLSLLIGFSGLLVLNGAAFFRAEVADVPGLVALIFAPISWSAGSVLQARRPVSISLPASAGWQHWVGASAFLIIAPVFEDLFIPTDVGVWIAFSYLVLIGSVIAFGAYLHALSTLPATLAMSYAYVNPIIAVFLGWMFLDEQVSPHAFVAAALIIIGVLGIFRFRRRV